MRWYEDKHSRECDESLAKLARIRRDLDEVKAELGGHLEYLSAKYGEEQAAVDVLLDVLEKCKVGFLKMQEELGN